MICPHRYPDLLRLTDVCQNGEHFRLVDCVHCGRYTIPLPDGSDPQFDPVPSEEELREFRAAERGKR